MPNLRTVLPYVQLTRAANSCNLLLAVSLWWHRTAAAGVKSKGDAQLSTVLPGLLFCNPLLAVSLWWHSTAAFGDGQQEGCLTQHCLGFCTAPKCRQSSAALCTGGAYRLLLCSSKPAARRCAFCSRCALLSQSFVAYAVVDLQVVSCSSLSCLACCELLCGIDSCFVTQ